MHATYISAINMSIGKLRRKSDAVDTALLGVRIVHFLLVHIYSLTSSPTSTFPEVQENLHACKTISDLVKPLKEARYVTVVAEGYYTTSLPLEDLLEDDVLLAFRLDGKPLEPEHGGPLRLVVPKKYAYKSAKWVRKLRFTEEQELGYWETRGYSNTADPWKEERYT